MSCIKNKARDTMWQYNCEATQLLVLKCSLAVAML